MGTYGTIQPYGDGWMGVDMTLEEARKLLITIQTAFPNYKPQNKEAAIALWANTMEDIPFNKAMTALKSYIRTDTTGFAPAIGQLISLIRMVETPEKMTPAEAWNRVEIAIRNGNYGCDEEFAKLPPDIQRAVGGPSTLRAWALGDEEKLGTVVKPTFERAYSQVVARSERVAMLPPNLRASLEYHPEEKEPPKEIPYHIEPEAFRTGVNADNVMELLERMLP